MNSNSSSFWTRFMSNFSIAPLELKVFVVFSFIAAFMCAMIIVFPSKHFTESIIPITGFAFFPYCATLLIVVQQLSRSKSLSNWTRSHLFHIRFLAFYILFESIKSLATVGNDYNDFNNPYLKISPWRPVWTVVLPALWILILLSPRIKKYYESLGNDSTAK